MADGDEQPRWRRMRGAATRVNASAKLVAAAKLMRELLPGDSNYGDPLSTAGAGPSATVARRLSDMTEQRPGVLRELGLSTLQVWQAASEAQGRGRGETLRAIAFTDLEDFSSYALDAGDDAALELLRDLGRAIEPPVKAAGGEVVKRLGDGMMAVFGDVEAAVDALREARENVAALEVEGFACKLRAGLHVGRPRRLAGDYFGVDVNVAARLAEQASGGELLVSDAVLEHLDTDGIDVRRKRRFKVKGVPRDLSAHTLGRRG
jgi:adenylate cyclase